MRLKRAYSPVEIQNMNIPSFDFTGEWEASLGRPARTGTWIIWGHPGNGKSSFAMQLIKYLCKFDRVIYDSLEESTGKSLQMSLNRHNMEEVSRKLLILDREPMDELSDRYRLSNHSYSPRMDDVCMGVVPCLVGIESWYLGFIFPS